MISGKFDLSVLAGPHILKEHCFIQNLDGIVTLVPCLGAMCAVQGIEITEPKQLSQGKVNYLLLCGSIMAFWHPHFDISLEEKGKCKAGYLSDSLFFADLSALQ